jgi:CubicO group peptidase (beta-lactamase class C family)
MGTMSAYWPLPGEWARVKPEAVGLDAAAVADAVAYAVAHESGMNRDIRQALEDGHFAEPPPINEIVGPVKDRAEPGGVIIRAGRIAAEWGDPERVDMTFSATKSYLSLCAGLAVDDGLIPDIHAPVRDLVDDGGFDSPQNRPVTWAQLLQLTSEWEGELWGKPDWIDHNRNLAAKPGEAADKGKRRTMQPPGTYWEYNDVRVNRLALALLRVFKEPLPSVLKRRIMDPIGASDTWAWHGYRNSYVEIAGKRMQSVSGGAHWGGGLWISTLDHARVGLLMLNRGKWNGQQLISEDWVRLSTTPCPLNQSYGLMWWLNAGGDQAPAAPRSNFFAKGVGANIIWVDPDHDMVTVVRWIQKESFPGFAAKVIETISQR